MKIYSLYAQAASVISDVLLAALATIRAAVTGFGLATAICQSTSDIAAVAAATDANLSILFLVVGLRSLATTAIARSIQTSSSLEMRGCWRLYLFQGAALFSFGRKMEAAEVLQRAATEAEEFGSNYFLFTYVTLLLTSSLLFLALALEADLDIARTRPWLRSSSRAWDSYRALLVSISIHRVDLVVAGELCRKMLETISKQSMSLQVTSFAYYNSCHTLLLAGDRESLLLSIELGDIYLKLLHSDSYIRENGEASLGGVERSPGNC